MSSIDIDAIIQAAMSKSTDLARTLFRNYAVQARQDVQDFLARSKTGVERAVDLFLDQKIDREDLEDLILGKRDLAQMHALKQAGLARASIDTFVNGVLQILLDAVFAAIP
jgi:hypothetical protein